MITNEVLESQLAGLTRLKSLGQDLISLADLARLVKELQVERDQLRERVVQLEAECGQLRAERSQFMHAWADLAVSEEELERRSQQPGSCSLTELMEHLEKA